MISTPYCALRLLPPRARECDEAPLPSSTSDPNGKLEGDDGGGDGGEGGDGGIPRRASPAGSAQGKMTADSLPSIPNIKAQDKMTMHCDASRHIHHTVLPHRAYSRKSMTKEDNKMHDVY